MTAKHYILMIILLLSMTSCANLYEDSSKDALIAYVVRQNALNEQRAREIDKAEAVKAFQIQAIRGGFAYWDVDARGNVEFKWIGTRRK